jgi:UDP-N-acetyl-D-glucosamine/UDP-N-acetyl-D-galactosamine dehydrogenase
MMVSKLNRLFIDKKEKISMVGLGYVGLPLAVAFAEKGIEIIAFDINQKKIDLYKQGIDVTKEVGNERLKTLNNILYTSNPEDLKKAKFHIVAVPTPVSDNKVPNLQPVKGATKVVGQNLTKGSYVVFESTVFPGATEEICIPILEEESGLKCGVDFKVGYSPERINPGDEVHTVKTIVKVVAGMDEESLETISSVYELVVDAGVYKASSIKVAEAAKVIENSQRDINIAFINELSLIFDKMGIDTVEVLEAAGSKWNFLPFRPGLVGGHCIGVDPYYLTYKAQTLGYHPQIILSGRRINDNMGKHIAEKMVKLLISSDRRVKEANILIMGLTFKENCQDLRNSKVADVINELKEFGVNTIVIDPLADPQESKTEYDVELKDLNKIDNLDGIILAVAHNEYKNIDLKKLKSKYKTEIENPIFLDLKSVLNKSLMEELGYNLWRL